MPSAAYTTFLKNLSQVDRLLETYDRELRANSGRGKKKLDHLTRAGLVFLCSSFEVYVESVVQESGRKVVSSIRTPSKFPDEVKAKIADAVKKEKNELSPILFYDNWRKYYTDMIDKETSRLNTPKMGKIKGLFLDYFGIENDVFDEESFPFSSIDNIISERGDVAHNLFSEKYFKRVKLVEYMDTMKEAVKQMDIILYDKLPNIINKKPWQNTYV